MHIYQRGVLNYQVGRFSAHRHIHKVLRQVMEIIFITVHNDP